ncbi:MAG: hypothetical protein KAH38_09895 [Candidatus Hydrogenedentes bacterium]|nr:hypothetical protein [Candidatus Hydrogenedentota bacterium]
MKSKSKNANKQFDVFCYIKVTVTGMIMVLLFSACGEGGSGGTEPWSPCEDCEEAIYTVTTNPSSTITVSPTGPYRRGQEVTLEWIGNGDEEIFDCWTITPKSHIASESAENPTKIYITGDVNSTITSVTAHTITKSRILRIYWYPA